MVEEAASSKRRDVPTYLQTLIKQAEQRKVHFISLPMGMSRQKENQTRYIFSKGLIMWYAKWVLSSSSPALTFTTKASELSPVGETFFSKLSTLSVASIVPSSRAVPPLSPHSEIQGGGPGGTRDSPREVRSLLGIGRQRRSQRVLRGAQREIVPRRPRGRLCFGVAEQRVSDRRYPVFHVIFPADLPKFAVQSLPLLPLEPWTPPKKKAAKNSGEAKNAGEPNEANESKEGNELNESKEEIELNELKEEIELNESKESVEPKEENESKEENEATKSKEEIKSNEPDESKESTESNESKETTQPDEKIEASGAKSTEIGENAGGSKRKQNPSAEEIDAKRAHSQSPM